MNNDWNQININLLIQGDQREISRLYIMMEPWLKIIAKDDQELVNDIFLKLISKVDKYKKERSKFHNFAYTLCINTARTAYTKKKKEKNKLNIQLVDDYTLNLIAEEIEEDNISEKMELIMSHALTLTNFQQNFLKDFLKGKLTGENKEKAMFFLIKTKLIKKINETTK